MTRKQFRSFKCSLNIHRYHRIFGEAPWHKFCVDCKKTTKDDVLKAVYHARHLGAGPNRIREIIKQWTN